MIYLDTSAYLSVLFEEKGCGYIEKLTKGKNLCTSTFMFFEAERNIIHYARQKKLSLKIFELAIERVQKDIEGFYVKDLDIDLLFTKTFPVVTTPKSADLVHLRTALWFLNTSGLDLFVTTDEQQGKAARELGLPVS